MYHASRLYSFTLFRRTLAVATLAAVVLFVWVPIRAQLTPPMTIRGVVAGSHFTPPVISDSPSASAASTVVASHFKGVKICVDANGNGACDSFEVSTTSDAIGGFLLRSPTPGPIVAEISTASLNGGQPVTRRLNFRAPLEQIVEGANSGGSAVALSNVVISPMSTELARMMDADALSYQTAKRM